MMRRAAPPALLLLLAGCATAPRIAAPPPAPPAPLLNPPPVARPIDWREAPLAAGRWSYVREAAGSAARFGAAGATALFELRCDLASRRVTLSLPGTAGPLTLATSYGERALAASSGPPGRITASLAARDPLLDQLAFSRARFAAALPAGGRLVLPMWAEPVRVIEDCRG